MHALKAHVRNGCLVSDEPTKLPEGAKVEIQLTKVDSFADLAPDERAELGRRSRSWRLHHLDD
jgi:hypothetical protein